jgi:uncharacterized protein (TIGR03435 family)
MHSRMTLFAAAMVLVLIPAIALAQATDTFEVASVKPMGPVPGGSGPGRDAAGGIGGGCDGGFPRLDHNRFVVVTTPYALITWAYGYNKVWGCSFVSFGDLLTGGPSWIRSERFEIQALMPEGSPAYTLDQFMKGDAPQLEKMLKALLADRFKLVVRRETKGVPGYALVPGKGGPKIALSTEADKSQFGTRRQADQNGQMANKMVGRKVEMRDFAFMLLLNTHRPVIDKTGLKGEYNFDLEFAPFDSDTPVDSTAPSLFTALQEQLGLRLESAKVPLEGLVIDRAERPSGN